MPNYTPGPWYTAETGNHQGLVISEGSGESIAVAYDKANAPLLAAAPALLEALGILLKAEDDSLVDGGVILSDDLRQHLHNLIREAEGEG